MERRRETPNLLHVWYWIGYTYTDSSTNAYDPKDVVEYYSDKQQIPNKEIFLAGTKQNPYVFKLSEKQDFVYGKLYFRQCNLNHIFDSMCIQMMEKLILHGSFVVTGLPLNNL